MNVDCKYMFQYKNCWFNITLFEVDWESGFWYNFGFFKLTGSITDAQHSEDKSLFYFHNSNYMTRLDLLFITVYERYK